MHDLDTCAWGRPPATRFGDGLRLDRFPLGPGVDVWLAWYAATEGSRRAAVSSQLEIGVQLAGSLVQSGQRSGDQLYGPGEVSRLSVAEPYDVRYAADARRPGIIAGLTVEPEVVEREAGIDDDRELRFPAGRRAVEADRRLVALCEQLLRRRRRGEAPPPDGLAAVREDLARSCELSGPDPVIRGRKLLDRFFDRDLYLEHVAEEVGLHPTTFLRRFRRCYGLTPIQYRVKQRLNRAVRLGWAEPALPVAEVARRCGFDHLPYFHRAFRRYLGTTPARHRINQPASTWWRE
jgi:AraC-like DNA-binding protein